MAPHGSWGQKEGRVRNVLLERLLLQAEQHCLTPAARGELGLRREERESGQTGARGTWGRRGGLYPGVLSSSSGVARLG